MSKWRPRGWDTGQMIEEECRKNNYYPDDIDPRTWIEAGADAMLHALRKIPESGTVLDDLSVVSKSGKTYTTLFIPDDEPESIDRREMIMKRECQQYGCSKTATESVNDWHFCKMHADEYKVRFADALEAQRMKDRIDRINHIWGGKI